MHRSFTPAVEPLESRDTPTILASAPFPLPAVPAPVASPPSPALLLMHPTWPLAYSFTGGLIDATSPVVTPGAPPITESMGLWFLCPCPTQPTDPIP
jgi:hypothetical protein